MGSCGLCPLSVFFSGEITYGMTTTRQIKGGDALVRWEVSLTLMPTYQLGKRRKTLKYDTGTVKRSWKKTCKTLLRSKKRKWIEGPYKRSRLCYTAARL
jgi:hypothetical protein